MGAGQTDDRGRIGQLAAISCQNLQVDGGSYVGPIRANMRGMKRLWTIIGVRDVPRSFRWYQTLLGLAPGAPAHPDFGQLLDADGTVLLCLHEWGVEDHPTITSPDAATPGNGLLLFFRVDDFDAALVRARSAGTPTSIGAPVQIQQ